MSDDLGDQLNAWVNDLEKQVLINDEERKQITGAGAKAFAENLKTHTPYDEHKKSGKHLRDSIVYEPGKSVVTDGDTDAGFIPDKAYIARFLNDGTKHNRPTHFFDQAVADSKDTVMDAMAAKYHELKGDA